MTLHKGDTVTYIPFDGADESLWERGKVKFDKEDDEDFVFVVFKCNNEWDNYSNYTGQRTNVSDLKIGW